MSRVKSFGSKAKARLSSLSKALLRRKSKPSKAVASTTASNEEAHDSSLQLVKEAKFQPAEDGNLLSGQSSNHESSSTEAGRPQYRQLPSFGSLSGMVISSSSQFDLPVLANTSDAILEADPNPTSSSCTTYDMENSPMYPSHESSSTTNFNSEYVADASSEIYHHHEISSATEFDSEYSHDASTAYEPDLHCGTESHTTKPDAPKIRIPMVERSEMCLFPKSSVSSNLSSMANDDTAADDVEDCRYYGFCHGYDFSDSLVVLEDDNVRVGEVEEAEDVDEEFVKAWRSRHGYAD